MAWLPATKRGTGELNRLHRDMDDLFRGFLGDWDWPWQQRVAWPALDIAEDENNITLNAEVPGCKAEDIDIQVKGNTLTISGQKKEEEKKEEKGYYHVERSCGSFRRDIQLPNEVQSDKIDASCKNGVLTVSLPKAEQAKSYKVKIKGE